MEAPRLNINVSLYHIIGTLALLIIISFMVGNCSGKKSGEKEAEKAWKKERKVLLNRADSLENVAQEAAAKAQVDRALSEKREAKAWEALKHAKKADSLEDIRFAREIRGYRALISRPAKEIQDLMTKEYEMDTAYHTHFPQ
jgi:hypothetical protein